MYLAFIILFFPDDSCQRADHGGVPDSTRSTSEPSEVVVVEDTNVSTSSDGCDLCTLPPAADLLAEPTADTNSNSLLSRIVN